MKLVLLGLVAVLAGYSSTAAAQKSAAEWEAYGNHSAMSGERKLATNGFIAPELYASYEQGYREGLVSYCQQDAFELGIQGKIYRGVCNGPKNDSMFLERYNLGYRLHQATRY